ncbi:MAG: glycogen debranching protein GlgX [Leptolyngbyaceae bacterium]|nr:glycogen debranching protein GlgX [Leptolyngbyaceae bacterium]
MGSDILPGKSYPLGATVYPNGVNFSIFSKNATSIELLLFDNEDAAYPSRVISLDASHHRTFYYWHVFVSGIGHGQLYGYRVHGPYSPELGLRFDGQKVLLDPYARSVVGWHHYNRDTAMHAGDNCAQALRGVVVDTNCYDWEGDEPLNIPYSVSVIYELHVGGFTRNPNSGVAPEKRGTFAGLIEKIPYLKRLGVTAVELLPVHQFDEQDVAEGLVNYWGYSTMSFFAPHRRYSSRLDPLGPADEFRDMVKALHKAGIEVILDVVFNHTAEGHHEGPTFSFRGLENDAYYILEENKTYYSNYSGCGNTLKANHEIVARMIIDSLRYWVTEMHVDGFRFDLASVLARSRTGEPLIDPPILWTIESDPALAGTKIIAEAWDAGGLYQVGSFIGDRFAEWNGPFRDDVRRFIKSDPDTVKILANRIMGSPDIYPEPDREPNRSINFVTCHDGFTLNDLVAYNEKHNLANLEDNRDGANDNHSWNCGVEGGTTDPEIQALRLRQIKNLLTVMFLSQGTPMLLMGDEVRRTQLGNNNAYCQDNNLSWFDWDASEKHHDLLRFVRQLIAFTQSLMLFRQERILKVNYDPYRPHVIWHGVHLGQPDWGYDSHTLAFTLAHPQANERLHVMLNAFWEPLKFELPPLDRRERWYQIIDTSKPSPHDIFDSQGAIAISGDRYHVQDRSSVVLIAG